MSQHNVDQTLEETQENNNHQELRQSQDDEQIYVQGEEQLVDEENDVDQDELNDWVHNDQEERFNIQEYQDHPSKLQPIQTHPDSRYPEASSMKKMLDDNLAQMKARVQLLQITEQRNLQKAKTLDINSQKLQQNKLLRQEKLGLKQRFLEEEQNLVEKKKRDIKIQRDKHRQFVQNKVGLEGKTHLKNMQETRIYKDNVRINHYNTLESVYLENCQLHNKIQDDQRTHQQKQLKLWEDKYFKGQHNYKSKVQYEINSVAEKQEQLQDLERQESNLMQQLKVINLFYQQITQQIYQNSSNKYKEVKETPFQSIEKV